MLMIEICLHLPKGHLFNQFKKKKKKSLLKPYSSADLIRKKGSRILFYSFTCMKLFSFIDNTSLKYTL